MNEVMHVGIESPVERRKEILNIAIDAIQALKDFEMSKRILKEKSIYRKEFIKIITDLNEGIQHFKNNLPAMHATPAHEEKRKDVKVEKKEDMRRIVKKPFKRTHMDHLEDDIALLREKIARL